ncbi:hypothetical protein MBLNU230_g0873t1 [Neophaeotheca triangularis]
MEAAPPSYNEATLVDHWDLVARYIPSRDLCAASLVCRRWHAIFIPHLWGNPASHFGTENDDVYLALTRFKRTLQTARLLVRSLTHTLHLPPAQAELYNGPRDNWLRELLDRLPNLQSLVVRGLSFFDHAALQALRSKHAAEAREDDDTTRWNPMGERYAPRAGPIELPASVGSTFQAPTSTVPAFGLRLLDASRCPNVTSKGLAQALGRFESLLYLDFSYTTAARDQSVLAVLQKFSGLQVLKLRGIGMRDEDAELLARAIKLRVRSLDVRNNRIQNAGVEKLLEHCIKPTAHLDSKQAQASFRGKGSPSRCPAMGSEMLRIYQGTEFETYLRRAFASSFVSKLTIEDAPEGGVTHLYIADNFLTVEAVSALVGSGRLHCVDVGGVGGVGRSTSQHLLGSSSHSSPGPTKLGIGKLTAAFSGQAKDNLRFLRINHGLITQEVPRGAPEKPSIGPPAYPGESEGGRPVGWVDNEASSSTPAGFSQKGGRPRSYSSVVAERKARVESHTARLRNMHPAMLPHVATLVLTDVPTMSASGHEVHGIIDFVKKCAEEAHLARLQASLDWSLPPGQRGQTSAIKSSAENTFALKRIVLEMAPELTSTESNPSSSWQTSSNKSMTEDRDSENLWNAAESDFSFFGGEDDDSELASLDISHEQDRPVQQHRWETGIGSERSIPHGRAGPSRPMYDTIALLSGFRKSRRMAHQRQTAAGEESHTEGYWDGVVSVVRPSRKDLGPDEEYDYYGNTYSGWGLYR